MLVKWDYTNAKPLIEVKFKNPKTSDNIFIQIQGNQYRHAVEFFDKGIEKRIKKNKKE